ncbi:MAG: hypothetical protein AB7U62_04095 [Pseudolabrys sp.]
MTGHGSGRPFTRADYLALKAATRRACEAAGPLATISTQTRVDAALLSRYGNPDVETFAPIDVAMDLDALAGGDHLLRAWAELRGYKLSRSDQHAADEAEAIVRHLAPVAKELSDVLGELANITAETPAAAARVEKEVAEAEDVLRKLTRACRAVRARRSA